MRIVEPYTAVEPNNSGLRKRRLDALLSAWSMPRAMYLADSGQPPPEAELSAAEWPMWVSILRAARPVPPRSHISGLRTYARLAGWDLDELARDKQILIIKDQVAVRLMQSAVRIGYEWALLVPATVDGVPDGSAEAGLRKRFRTVELYEDQFLVSGSYSTCTDSVSVLIGDAVANTSPASLRRVWELSLALDLERAVLADMPVAAVSALAEFVRLGTGRRIRPTRFSYGRPTGAVF
jgi:hypothetical protein